MTNFSKFITIILSVILFASCQVELKPDPDFGAYYTKIESNEDFERFSRTGNYSDIIVDLGANNGELVFWRGSSYLPYWKSVEGEVQYFPEIFPRSGNGNQKIMPDRVNTYTHVKIIENNADSILIHWRYIQSFKKGNPDLEVAPEGFVDEYFTIFPEGEIERRIHRGQKKSDDWNNPGNLIRQSVQITKKGIVPGEVTEAKMHTNTVAVKGADLIEGSAIKPLLKFSFDEGVGETTKESVSIKAYGPTGRKVLWRKGVSGTCLQFDGYNTEIRIPVSENLTIENEITLQAFVAMGAYPWSWCPIVQQCDDVPEEIERIKKHGNYSTKLKKEDDTGFFLGINGDGNPGFKLKLGQNWREITADIVLDRRQWYLLTATYSQESGLMKLYVNEKVVARKRVGAYGIQLSEKDILIGRGKVRRPINPVRRNTFPGQFAFDGLIDEVSVYNIALEKDDIVNYNKVARDQYEKVDMDKRILPAGKQKQQFGAYYDHLKFYDVWDNLWCFGKYPDVVVGFDHIPSKFVFWRGVSYIPMMVNEKGQWYSNEFNETWGTSGGDGCQEPMSDKGNYFTYSRILENTPARVVVHYRFPLADVNLVKANYVEETGWYDVADWYYYIYPDGIATKQKHLWTSGERNHEWQESMAIFGPDQHPEQIIETRNTVTMQNMEGDSKTYNWTKAPPPNVSEPENQSIQTVNYTGKYDPITIGEAFEGSNVYGGELTPYSVFPTWNHWPVAQMPSDGRYASFPDRTGHSSLTHVYLPVYDQAEGDRPFYEKLLMEAMINTDDTDLVQLARSWNHAPEIEILGEGKAFYEKPQRAYIVENVGSEIELLIKANPSQPLFNLCVIVKDWGRNEASIFVNDRESKSKQGIVRDTDGSYKLVVWVDIMSEEELGIKIRRSGE